MAGFAIFGLRDALVVAVVAGVEEAEAVGFVDGSVLGGVGFWAAIGEAVPGVDFIDQYQL
jgi:hypothetical protein